MADTHDTSNTVYTVHVQRRDVTLKVDEYVVEDGYTPIIEGNDDEELIVTKRSADNTTEKLVAMYARGCWLRVWTEES
jgi:hypothetical protein